jgi:serine/arginine repetitive matrix protein 2
MTLAVDVGHVRRRSIGSIITQSPSARVEKRKHGAFAEDSTPIEKISPNKVRVIEKPSIASTASSR